MKGEILEKLLKLCEEENYFIIRVHIKEDEGWGSCIVQREDGTPMTLLFGDKEGEDNDK